MRKRCSICRSRNLIQIKKAILCADCENVVCNQSKNSTIEMMTSEIAKKQARNQYNKQLEETQKKQTKKPYLRFQLRIV